MDRAHRTDEGHKATKDIIFPLGTREDTQKRKIGRGTTAVNNSQPGQLWMGADYTSWADLATRARGIDGWREMIRVKFPHIKNTLPNKKRAGKNSNFNSLLRPTGSSSYGAVVLPPDRVGAN